MARELDLEGRMRAAGYDSTGTIIPFGNLRLPTMQPKFGTTFNISAELDAWHSVSTFDPTANVALLEFLLRVPDDQSYLHGQECYLFKRAFRNRMPDAVLYNRRKGLQAADVGHRILSEQARFRATLHSLEAVPEAKDFLDFALLYRCLEDLTVKVDPMTTLRAGAILLRGIGVGLFLHRLTSPAR
jgi:asparagine synthase (glutamine-hydrolysing)